MNVTDMEMFTAMMSSPEAAEVDAKYNIVDTIYSMDKIS